MNIFSFISGIALFRTFATGVGTQSCPYNLTESNGNIYFNTVENYCSSYNLGGLNCNCSWHFTPPNDERNFILTLRFVNLRRYVAPDEIIFPDGSIMEYTNIDFSKNTICKIFAKPNIPLHCLEEMQRQAFCSNISVTTTTNPSILRASASPSYDKRYAYYYYNMNFIFLYSLQFCPDPANETNESQQSNDTKYIAVIAVLCLILIICGLLFVLYVARQRKRVNKNLLSQVSVKQQDPVAASSNDTYAEVKKETKRTQVAREDEYSTAQDFNADNLCSNIERKVAVSNILYHSFDENPK